jgi:hypothetical protein
MPEPYLNRARGEMPYEADRFSALPNRFMSSARLRPGPFSAAARPADSTSSGVIGKPRSIGTTLITHSSSRSISLSADIGNLETARRRPSNRIAGVTASEGWRPSGAQQPAIVRRRTKAGSGACDGGLSCLIKPAFWSRFDRM